MTYPDAVRQEALAGLALGQSALSIGKRLGIEASTVLRWGKTATEEIPSIAKPIRERVGADLIRAMVLCAERTLALLPMMDDAYRTSGAAKNMGELAFTCLGWDRPEQVPAAAAPLILQQFITMAPDERRRLLNPSVTIGD